MFAICRTRPLIALQPALTLLITGLAATVGCPSIPWSPSGGSGAVGLGNATDNTNGNARYVGSSACRQCHSEVAARHDLHGHAWALNRIQGGPPQFPAGTSAGVPDPPRGFLWSDISYVIGGYRKRALFIDRDGYLLTSGVTGVDTQWNLAFPPNGTAAGFAPYEPTAAEPVPFEFPRFRQRTTGPQPLEEDRPAFQENRPGLRGTWSEPGVQCEVCHGPGSGHFRTDGERVVVDIQRIFVDPDGAASCKPCHSQPFGEPTGAILASGGFIDERQQYAELRASGGHARFSCTVCHDPHRSVTYDRRGAIRNECRACHATTTMAGHGGKVFTRGNYSETLTCESCHMPFATRSASSASPDVVGPQGRMADTRTHIFRISTAPADYRTFLTDDGRQVRRDAEGRAAVTVDFVCLRCHNDIGTFGLRLERAAEIAQRIHDLP
jgi:uncharacterized CHY-type Zn-finger protein